MKRDVSYEHEFDAELKGIEDDFERADKLIQGIEWVLQRDPESGTKVSTNPPVWFIPAIEVVDLPYVIFYTFDDRKVCMLSIRVADPEAIAP